MSYFTANLTREEEEVRAELARQDAKWGEQNHPDGTGRLDYSRMAADWKGIVDAAAKQKKLTWRHILMEEVYEACAESDPEKLLSELLQVEAVARQWRKTIRRRLAREAGDRG